MYYYARVCVSALTFCLYDDFSQRETRVLFTRQCVYIYMQVTKRNGSLISLRDVRVLSMRAFFAFVVFERESARFCCGAFLIQKRLRAAILCLGFMSRVLNPKHFVPCVQIRIFP